MSRPATKSELLTAANDQFDKLWKLIDSMSGEEKSATFHFGDDPKEKEAHWKRDQNLRDVLIHLYEWHQLLLNWIASNTSGVKMPFLPEPYNWKTYSHMNVMFWEKHQSTPCSDAREMLQKSHDAVIEAIGQFSNDELFEKKRFSWTGTSTLGSYFVSVTSSHYDWAMKKIKKHIKTYRDNQ